MDWSQGHEFLDTELQQIVPDAASGRRHADKLVRINAFKGIETWALIHVEVQGKPDRNFAERMFVYHYRLREADVMNLAVLTDRFSSFRPEKYEYALGGCELSFRFPDSCQEEQEYSAAQGVQNLADSSLVRKKLRAR